MSATQQATRIKVPRIAVIHSQLAVLQQQHVAARQLLSDTLAKPACSQRLLPTSSIHQRRLKRRHQAEGFVSAAAATGARQIRSTSLT